MTIAIAGMTAARLFHMALRTLILPPASPLLLMLAGWIAGHWYRRLGAVVTALGFISLWMLCTPLIADRLARAVESYPPLDWTSTAGAQAIVILSAGSRRDAPEYRGDAPDDDTLQRIAYGAYVARRTGLPLLVSGGSFGTEVPLAQVMRQSLERDFNTAVRWTEDTSLDTHENALNSAAILRNAHIHRVILVTSALHMPRSVAEFKATGLEIVPAPADFVTTDEQGLLALLPAISAARRSHAALYELAGGIVRRIRIAPPG